MNQSQPEPEYYVCDDYTMHVLDCYSFRGKQWADVQLQVMPDGPCFGFKVAIEGSGDNRTVRFPHGVWSPSWYPANKSLERDILDGFDQLRAEYKAAGIKAP